MNIIIKHGSLLVSTIKRFVADFYSSGSDGYVCDVICDGSVIDTLYVYKNKNDDRNSVCLEIFGEKVCSLFDENKIIDAVTTVFTVKEYKIAFFE